MATRLLGRVKERMIDAGAELGARVASRALDAAEAMDRARLNVGRLREDGPGRLKAAARKVPVVGKRLERAPEALRAAAARVPAVGKRVDRAPEALRAAAARVPALGKRLDRAPEALRAAAARVPLLGKRMDRAPEALRAAAARVPVLGKRLASRAKGKAPAAEELKRETKRSPGAVKRSPIPEPTPLRFTPVGASADFKGRKVVTSRGRKTMPAAAAKRVHAKAQPEGFKAKRGQKKRH